MSAAEQDDIDPSWNLDTIVQDLRHSRTVTHNVRPKGHLRLSPSRTALAEIVDGLAAALFPTHYSQSELRQENIDYFVGNTLNAALLGLAEQVHRSYAFTQGDASHDEIRRQSLAVVRDLGEDLPAIRALLVSDLRAAFQDDPAVTNFPEILLGYPGITAMIHHRIAHRLYRSGAVLIARLVAEIAHSKTGIDIHPAAEIGPSFFIDHGTGVVIGQTAIIGERVRIYQGVTLGARSFALDEDGALEKGGERHPIIEDDVFIYAGATILGRITIGKGSQIGGNVWLTRSVPAGSSIAQAKAQNAGPAALS